ncbi:lipid-A-disaccharide synthase [Saccharibacter floricola]|uniref:Lipid-A-disaccharide synthase n=1 Tax=Saccharibacter floricola DSM 15669 TaxID=1123227 RepID=A0ABQ0NXX8_9PROT|nr:lipid-A-disaccharide synthase [Saccharibacter floricola]GBQ05515.1 lipid-A-disaccharide synthase [Saccharibacter floricola DSM 15669]
MVHMVPVKGQVPLHHHGRVIWILAGEASGDVIGARLMQALHRHDPSLVFAGLGGGRMEALGLRSLFPMRELSIMGFVEIIPRLKALSQRLLEAEQDIELRRPDLVITIDSPGFSFRLLRRIAPLGMRRLHYVAPQVWAWREKRLRHYKGLWDRLLCLFPFEPEWFAQRGFEGRFVGHPVLQSGVTHGVAERFYMRHDVERDSRILLLMPGSRRSEIPRLMPIFKKMVTQLHRYYPKLSVVVPATPLMAPLVRKMLASWECQPIIVTDLHDKHDAFAAADCALTKSGTSTLELAMAYVPMAVTYRVNPISAFIARRLLKVPYVAMVNLLAGREVVPELLQERCTPQCLAQTVKELMDNPEKAKAQREAYTVVLEKLAPTGGRTPSDAAAEEVIELLNTPLSALRERE